MPDQPNTFMEARPKGAGGRPEVAAAGLLMLDQCAAFVETVGDAAYRSESTVQPGGTIGRHIRHILDHFRAAVEHEGTSERPIDYDRRERDVPMERERRAALEAMAGLRRRLSVLDSSALARRVSVRVMVGADGREAVLESTLGRELAFASHHAVHHHAMLRAIAAEFGVAVAPGFGLAPSTAHQASARS